MNMTNEKIQKSEKYFTLFEIILWVLIDFIFFVFMISKTTTYEIVDGERIMVTDKNSNDIYVVILIILVVFPIIYKLIFTKLPVASLRYLVKKEKNDDLVSEKDDTKTDFNNITEYSKSLIQISEKLSKKIFDRAGIYLLVGIMVALIGLIYFSIRAIDVKKEISTIYDYLISIVPNVGLLFFIELIAFFFFKQYRITMDEFKYYEAIKRQREANFSILLLSKDENFEKIVSKLNLTENVDKLGKDETSQSVELRKLSNSESMSFS